MPKPGHVLDDRNSSPQQCRVHRSIEVARIVDAERVDSDQGSSGSNQKTRSRLGQERMALEIGVGSPVNVPTGADQNRPSGKFDASEALRPDRRRLVRGRVDHDAGQIDQSVQRNFGEIKAVRETMVGRVEIRAGIGDQFDLADLKLDAVRIERSRRFPAIRNRKRSAPAAPCR